MKASLEELEPRINPVPTIYHLPDPPANLLALAQQATHSPLWDSHYATTLCQSLLARTPTTDEVPHWDSYLESGTTPLQLEAAFLTSPEYTTRQLTQPVRTSWINSLYQNVLGRSGAVSELQGWPQLPSYNTALAFCLSREHQLDLISQDYSLLLYRTPLPQESQAWLATTQPDPTRLPLAFILASPEYWHSHGSYLDTWNMALHYNLYTQENPNAS